MVVGDAPANLEAVKTGKLPKKARERMDAAIAARNTTAGRQRRSPCDADSATAQTASSAPDRISTSHASDTPATLARGVRGPGRPGAQDRRRSAKGWPGARTWMRSGLTTVSIRSAGLPLKGEHAGASTLPQWCSSNGTCG